jgi:hypothetical protein
MFGIPLDPEMVAQIQRERDLHRMSHDQMRHDSYQVLHTLNEEQLKMFSVMLAVMSSQESVYATYLDGYVDGLLEQKYNVCPACGRNHDELPPDMVAPPPPGEAVNEDSTAPTTPYVLTEEDLANMEEYNLDDLRDEDTHELLGFICKGCQLRYISITDRMLKRACHGCQLKSAHG